MHSVRRVAIVPEGGCSTRAAVPRRAEPLLDMGQRLVGGPAESQTAARYPPRPPLLETAGGPSFSEPFRFFFA
jgi:hypothetical protein